MTDKLRDAATQLPVVALLGPRQSGKTTLARATFPHHTYVSLEELDNRDLALTDPRAFLSHFRGREGMIIDEIQYAPLLMSYIQTIVDQENIPGFFIITGSHNILLNQAILQSLAGRVALCTLLPLTIGELVSAQLASASLDVMMQKGLYPRVYSPRVNSNEWCNDYITTYIERDVRQIQNIINLSDFKRFIQLCAGRIGQLLNVSSLANDCGISQATAHSWLSLLEASYIIFLLQPHYQNFSRRLVKTQKLYFYDTGLVCSLLGIESAEQLFAHYLRGNLFECFIISDFIKQQYNNRKSPNIYFWRDNHGHEVDCVIEKGTKLIPIEIKAGSTVNSNFFDGLMYWNKLAEQDPITGYVIYGGSDLMKRTKGTVVGWQSVGSILE